MATAPFLLLIVAALPRAEAAPVVSTIAHEARAAASVVTRAVVAAIDESDDVKAQLAIAHAPAVTKRLPKPKLIAALPTPPLAVEAPPVLAARVEPGEPRGPPA